MLSPEHTPVHGNRASISQTPTRILVAKASRFDADIVAQSARSVCPSAEVHVCFDGRQALALTANLRMDLSLIGLNLPDIDGLDLCDHLAGEDRAARLLLVAEHITETTARLMPISRIDGFFDCSVETAGALAPAIRAVAEGTAHYSYSPRQARIRTTEGRIPLDLTLSPAELLVFAALGGEWSDQEAATHLGLSIGTVLTQLKCVMRKLNVRSRAELNREAIRRGVVRISGNNVIRPGMDRAMASRIARRRTFGAVEAIQTIR